MSAVCMPCPAQKRIRGSIERYMQHTVHDYVQDFLEYLDIERGRSEKTIGNYERSLKLFLASTRVQSPKSITNAKVKAFQEYLKQRTTSKGTQLKTCTQNYHLIALRAFLRFLNARGVTSLPAHSVVLAREPLRSEAVLTREQAMRLHKALHKRVNVRFDGSIDVCTLRDNALVALLSGTGLHVAEAVALNTTSITKSGVVVGEARGATRRVALTSATYKVLRTYLTARTDADSALFINMGRNANEHNVLRLTPRSVERIVASTALRAGVDVRVPPLVLRRTFIEALGKQGVPLAQAQTLLGHKHDLTTKRVYRVRTLSGRDRKKVR